MKHPSQDFKGTCHAPLGWRIFYRLLYMQYISNNVMFHRQAPYQGFAPEAHWGTSWPTCANPKCAVEENSGPKFSRSTPLIRIDLTLTVVSTVPLGVLLSFLVSLCDSTLRSRLRVVTRIGRHYCQEGISVNVRRIGSYGFAWSATLRHQTLEQHKEMARFRVHMNHLHPGPYLLGRSGFIIIGVKCLTP